MSDENKLFFQYVKDKLENIDEKIDKKFDDHNHRINSNQLNIGKINTKMNSVSTFFGILYSGFLAWFTKKHGG